MQRHLRRTKVHCPSLLSTLQRKNPLITTTTVNGKKESCQFADFYNGIGMLQDYIAFLRTDALEDDTRHHEEVLFALQRNPLPNNGTREQFTKTLCEIKANHNPYLGKMELRGRDLSLLIISFLLNNLRETRFRLKQNVTEEPSWGGNDIDVMRVPGPRLQHARRLQRRAGDGGLRRRRRRLLTADACAK